MIMDRFLLDSPCFLSNLHGHQQHTTRKVLVCETCYQCVTFCTKNICMEKDSIYKKQVKLKCCKKERKVYEVNFTDLKLQQKFQEQLQQNNDLKEKMIQDQKKQTQMNEKTLQDQQTQIKQKSQQIEQNDQRYSALQAKIDEKTQLQQKLENLKKQKVEDEKSIQVLYEEQKEILNKTNEKFSQLKDEIPEKLNEFRRKTQDKYDKIEKITFDTEIKMQNMDEEEKKIEADYEKEFPIAQQKTLDFQEKEKELQQKLKPFQIKLNQLQKQLETIKKDQIYKEEFQKLILELRTNILLQDQLEIDLELEYKKIENSKLMSQFQHCNGNVLEENKILKPLLSNIQQQNKDQQKVQQNIENCNKNLYQFIQKEIAQLKEQIEILGSKNNNIFKSQESKDQIIVLLKYISMWEIAGKITSFNKIKEKEQKLAQSKLYLHNLENNFPSILELAGEKIANIQDELSLIEVEDKSQFEVCQNIIKIIKQLYESGSSQNRKFNQVSQNILKEHNTAIQENINQADQQFMLKSQKCEEFIQRSAKEFHPQKKERLATDILFYQQFSEKYIISDLEMIQNNNENNSNYNENLICFIDEKNELLKSKKEDSIVNLVKEKYIYQNNQNQQSENIFNNDNFLNSLTQDNSSVFQINNNNNIEGGGCSSMFSKGWNQTEKTIKQKQSQAQNTNIFDLFKSQNEQEKKSVFGNFQQPNQNNTQNLGFLSNNKETQNDQKPQKNQNSQGLFEYMQKTDNIKENIINNNDDTNNFNYPKVKNPFGEQFEQNKKENNNIIGNNESNQKNQSDIFNQNNNNSSQGGLFGSKNENNNSSQIGLFGSKNEDKPQNTMNTQIQQEDPGIFGSNQKNNQQELKIEQNEKEATESIIFEQNQNSQQNVLQNLQSMNQELQQQQQQEQNSNTLTDNSMLFTTCSNINDNNNEDQKKQEQQQQQQQQQQEEQKESRTETQTTQNNQNINSFGNMIGNNNNSNSNQGGGLFGNSNGGGIFSNNGIGGGGGLFGNLTNNNNLNTVGLLGNPFVAAPVAQNDLPKKEDDNKDNDANNSNDEDW